MSRRSEFVQIRVTPEEKAVLKNLAESSGQDLSSYILSRSLPSNRLRFHELLRLLREGADRRFVLAELNDLLASLAPVEFSDAVGTADLTGLSPLLRNYVAAMVEQACRLKAVTPPPWAGSVEPLERPHFASPLRSLRLHLLRASPVPFKRRNIFVDSSVGERV
jgi:uncharacterized protein (DUF1778 family)